MNQKFPVYKLVKEYFSWSNRPFCIHLCVEAKNSTADCSLLLTHSNPRRGRRLAWRSYNSIQQNTILFRSPQGRLALPTPLQHRGAARNDTMSTCVSFHAKRDRMPIIIANAGGLVLPLSLMFIYRVHGSSSFRPSYRALPRYVHVTSRENANLANIMA